MRVGVDYYPEHWPRERWETDAHLMREAGFNVVRLAEFSWVLLEPEEGRFEFAWLDDALNVLGKEGVDAILGTPTGSMPAWVARKYPEVLRVQVGGERLTWGVRKDNCLTSGVYRMLSERITRALAEHYRDHPHVIGWQTDNEFGNGQHPFCYCANCRADFQDWVRARYGTLEELNRRWGTHFWGHKYQTWGEVQPPPDMQIYNPSLCLDWYRYQTFLNVRFQREQVRILRELCPNQFITHNFMPTVFYNDLDYYQMAEDLDHVSWDNYPNYPPEKKGDDYIGPAAGADVIRGLKRGNFWIMEQTAGPGGWSIFGRNPRPGEIRKIAYQQLAHGADGQIWFRWRTCTAGREQYWHGLLGHDGRPLRRYREAAQTAGEYQKLSPELAGTTVKAQVAMVYDFECAWAVKIQPGFAGNDYVASVHRYYAPLLQAGVNVDMVRPDADLSGYRLVVTPNLYLLPDIVARRLSDYVAAGGVLVVDCRTGVKDETSLCHDRTLPGLLGDALGITIEEYEGLPENTEYPVAGGEIIQGRYTAIRYADWVTLQGGEALAAYEGPWHMKGFAAATRNRFGKGSAYYVGTVIKEPDFYRRLLVNALGEAQVRPPLTPPEGVEVSVREGAGKRLLFVINHTEEPSTVPVPAGRPDLLSGETTGDTIVLDCYGVAVIKLQ